MTIFRHPHHLLRIWTTLIALVILLSPAHSRLKEDYAAQSVLANGNWVKISTTASGIHQISEDSLQAWGFSNPKNVKLFGYGGPVIDELFSNNDGYIDDLPQIPLWYNNGNLYFYSQGTTRWELLEESQEFTHRLHPYSTRSYYFLTDQEIEPAMLPTYTPNNLKLNPVTSFDEHTFHENEWVSLGKTGQNFFGEDFLNNPRQDFTFHLPGAQPLPMKIRVSFGAKVKPMPGYIHIAYNGTELPIDTANKIKRYYDEHEFLTLATPLHTVDQASEQSTISLRYESENKAISAYLDYIRLNYKRKLQLYDGQVQFRFINRNLGDYYCLENVPPTTVVWDVTTPHAPENIMFSYTDSVITFTPKDGTLREFVAFDPATKFPSPSFVCPVENQNLHTLEIPELTIITPTALQSEAERVAELHRAEGMSVTVIDQEKIFNEFSSGIPDASAYRRLLKMFYDRARNINERPKYLLLFGDGSYDNRQAMTQLHTPDCNLLLTYQSVSSIDERESFVVEDYFGFLDDNTGKNIKSDKVCLGIGRYPVSTLLSARTAVDKLYRYVENKDLSPWKNNISIVADDGDEMVHTNQAECGTDTLISRNTDNPRLGFRINKVYIDSYYMDPASKQCPEANRAVMQQFKDGMLVFTYIGHNDAEIGFTGEGIFSRYQMEHLTNSRLPLFMTITCNYCRFDEGIAPSAGEQVLLNPYGGAIALITTTRVVFTDGNDKIHQQLSRRFFQRNIDRTRLRIGDVLRIAKRDFTKPDRNKLNYILMGDPALTILYPEYEMRVDRIDGEEAAETEMTPGESYIVEGYICDYRGDSLPDFNGRLYYRLYDEEKKITTRANNSTRNYTYRDRPDLLTSGQDTIVNGRFKTTVILPAENSHSGKPGLLNLYACDTLGREANGYTDKLLIGTTYITEPTDTDGPHFEQVEIIGDPATGDATFSCRFSDPSGIQAGNSLGKQMSAFLNGNSIEANVTRYYHTVIGCEIPTGEFNYPLPQLSRGLHSFTFKVFDSLGNSSETTTTFEVNYEHRKLHLHIEEEPVTETATITCRDNEGNEIHDIAQARISITNALGEEVWATESTGENLFPLTWNLQNLEGKRVAAARYECRGYFETATGTIATPAKKIVVITQ